MTSWRGRALSAKPRSPLHAILANQSRVQHPTEVEARSLEATKTMTRCLAALLFAWCLCAQSDPILVNGTPLRIGMPRSDVLAFLAERNDLVKLESLEDGWCVKVKGKE